MDTKFRALVVATVVLALVSCSETPVSTDQGPEASLDGIQEAVLPPNADIDDRLAAIGDKLPGGFGGMYWEDDVLILLLQDTGQTKAAIEALLSMTPPAGPIQPPVVLVREVEYSFRQLLTWQREFTARATDGSWVYADVNEMANMVEIGIPETRGLSSLDAQLASLDVPEQARLVRHSPAIVGEALLTDRVRPIMGGLEHQYGPGVDQRCTISFMVNHWQKGRTAATASHCSNSQGSVDSAIMHQDSWGAPDAIGIELLDPALTNNLPGCPAGRVCRRSDATLYDVHDSVSFSHARIAKVTGTGSKTLSGGPHHLIGTANPHQFCLGGTCALVGAAISKVGMATGLTHGSVTAQCVAVPITLTNITILCANRANYTSAPGDSGSPVFGLGFFGADNAKVYGTHFASDGTNRWFNDILLQSIELGNTSQLCNGFRVSSEYGVWC